MKRNSETIVHLDYIPHDGESASTTAITSVRVQYDV